MAALELTQLVRELKGAPLNSEENLEPLMQELLVQKLHECLGKMSDIIIDFASLKACLNPIGFLDADQDQESSKTYQVKN